MVRHAVQSRTATPAESVPEPAPSGTRASTDRAKALDASALRRALLETGTSEEALARRLGCSRALVRKLEAGDGLTAERVSAVCSASPRLGAALLGVLRAQLDTLEGGPASEPGSALPRLAAELGDVARSLVEADADGVRTRDELLALDRELAELEEAVRAVRRWCAGRLG